MHAFVLTASPMEAAGRARTVSTGWRCLARRCRFALRVMALKLEASAYFGQLKDGLLVKARRPGLCGSGTLVLRGQEVHLARLRRLVHCSFSRSHRLEQCAPEPLPDSRKGSVIEHRRKDKNLNSKMKAGTK